MDDFFAEEEDTNPFSKAAAQYIEDHQEEEEEKLRALKDAMNVPAVVCENRDKLLQVWVHNMKKWRESASRLDGKEKEIAEQKRSNSRLREEIKEAEEKLRSFQSDVEKRCGCMIVFLLVVNRISFLQAKLNNHLVQNELDRPVRASFAQPDLMDMFRAVLHHYPFNCSPSLRPRPPLPRYQQRQRWDLLCLFHTMWWRTIPCYRPLLLLLMCLHRLWKKFLVRWFVNVVWIPMLLPKSSSSLSSEATRRGRLCRRVPLQRKIQATKT